MHFRSLSLVLAAALVVQPAANALVVHGDPGPAPDPAAYVGQYTDASAVFLGDINGDGNYWVITAHHVSDSGIFTLGGVNYTLVDSGVVLSDLDVHLFRIVVPDGSPVLSLSPMKLATTTPTLGTDLVLVGNGGRNQGDLTWWNASWENEIGTPEYYGYSYESGLTFTWGNGMAVPATDGVRDFILSPFLEDQDGSAYGVSGDSGGGFFVNVGGEWQLAGLTLAHGTFAGQPVETAVFNPVPPEGNWQSFTLALDIATYRDVILAAIPEPSLGGLAAVGALHFLLRRRRQRVG